MHPRKIGRLLASDPGLQPVVEKALQISALAKLCVGFLPPALGRQIRAVNLKDGQLLILAASPAAAAKLKLLSEGLREFLSETGQKVKGVLVRVQPGVPQELIVAPQKERSMPEAGLRALGALHEKLADSPARSALKRLLDHQTAGADSGARASTRAPRPKRQA